VLFGTAHDGNLGDQLRVTLIATGLNSATRKVAQRAQPGRGGSLGCQPNTRRCQPSAPWNVRTACGARWASSGSE
jgi:cell division protein FtsZ